MAVCAAAMLALQVALAQLPNIEVVSLLVMAYTLTFRRRTLYVIYAFVLLEGLVYGFHIWWISYLYVWTMLCGAAWLLRRMRHPLGWAALSGGFGLAFGALCALPYLATGGWAAAVAYWAAGIPFDLLHCGGNFVLCLLLWKPLRAVLTRLEGAL
jgi:energy-coupling factor transport system substrate-specific component